MGTWTRLASKTSRWDLVTYVCNSQHRFSYFIHAAGCSVKMDVPFGIVADAKLVSVSPDTAQASFYLSRSPLFFLEDVQPAADGKNIRKWVRCADWTEGLQASAVLKHDVTGPASALAYVWQSISAFRNGPQSAYFMSPSPTSSSPSLPNPAVPYIQGRDHRPQPPALDYLNTPLLQTHGTPYLRPYHTTIHDVRPIDTTSSRLTTPFGLPLYQSHAPVEISPTISSPTFSDVSGSVGDSPQLTFSNPSLESSPEFHRQNSLPPLLMRRTFSRPSLSHDQNHFSGHPKSEAHDDASSTRSSYSRSGSSAPFWPSG